MIFVGKMPDMRPQLGTRSTSALALRALQYKLCPSGVLVGHALQNCLHLFESSTSPTDSALANPKLRPSNQFVADMGLAPEQILLLDDMAINAAGARASGLRAVQEAGTADIERALATWFCAWTESAD